MTPQVETPARRRRLLPGGLLAAWLTLIILAPTAPAQLRADGGADFVNLCARCHGRLGDGLGAEVLDRPARNFRDGGFSFGNTQAAVERTIRFGIPGSPMPAFGETLSDTRLAALAAHVLSLAPAVAEVSEADTILSVSERAVVVRGGLPPITDGAMDHPRGLLLGLPEGLSFEYRADDLRLLGVRAGDFVRRSDWTGRGGTPLEPLGRVVWLAQGGDPAPLLQRRLAYRDEPLQARLRATRTPAGRPSIDWDALSESSEIIAHVREFPRVVVTSLGTGFARELVIVTTGDRHVSLQQPMPAGKTQTSVGRHGRVILREDGLYEAWLLQLDSVTGGEARELASPEHLGIELQHGATAASITLTTVLMAQWPEDGEAQLLAELKR